MHAIQRNGSAYVPFNSIVHRESTEALLQLMAELASGGARVVHLAISTPGGTVMDGLNAYNVLRSMPFRLITHNVGNVNSVGNIIFLAGEERYACPTSSFMFHGVGVDITGEEHRQLEEKRLRELLDNVLNQQKLMASIIQSRTTIGAREVKRLFRQAATKDTAYAMSKGIIRGVKEFVAPKGGRLLKPALQQ